MFRGSSITQEALADANLDKIIKVTGNSSYYGMDSTFYDCNNLTNISMNNLEEIDSYGSSADSFNNTFYYCKKLKEVHFPKLKFFTNGCGGMFNGCSRLKVIDMPLVDRSLPVPDGFYYGDKTKYTNWGYYDGTFNGCYSLKSVPHNLIDFPLDIDSTSVSYPSCSNMYNSCYQLEEIYLPVKHATTGGKTSNYIYNNLSSSNDLYMVKHWIFQTNPDGTPIVSRFKGSTIEIRSLTGAHYYGNSTTMSWSNIIQGIQNQDWFRYGDFDVNKMMWNAETFELYRDDPQAYICQLKYNPDTKEQIGYKMSWYNHDAAVETINTLPDTSDYGTNTIKMYGGSGEFTGGRIDTLTAEEIAVATAKGWTVALI